MKVTYFIGIDISKSWLDFTVLNSQNIQLHYERIENTKRSIKRFINKLRRDTIELSSSIFCMEYTGLYEKRVLDMLLNDFGAQVWMESGAQISLSMGLTRGKNDKVDSARIAYYALSNHTKARLYKAPRPIIEQLKILSSERKRLVKSKQQHQVAVKEQSAFLDKKMMSSTRKRAKKVINNINQCIKQLEAEVKELINSDMELKRLYKIVQSVDGIGLVSSIEFLVTTNEFKKIDDPRKFACMSGVAPFKQQSGTSRNSQSRVSHRANKKTKHILHMAALSAITIKGEYKDFYERQLKNGKNKMSIINAIRNKLIHRVFACVRDNREYKKNYKVTLG